eukprot:XP_011674665.1 PREDICTED: coiled-coil and C2 domain-containing protein 2A [Strongylocentrotus purpuratus]
MSQTFREKIEKRRRDMRENTMADSTLLADTSSATPGRGSRHDEDISAADGGVDDVEEMAADPIEEIQQAESLMEKLTLDRESKKKELFQSLEPADEEQEKKKPKPKRRTPAEIPTIQETGEEEDEEPDEDTKPKKKEKRKRNKADMAAAVLGSKTSVETGKAPSTMNATIRDRIRKKMAEAKEKAEESMKVEVANDPNKDLPARRLRGLRARDKATRFDEPSLLTKEEIEEDKMLNESIIAKEKWREAFKQVKAKQSALPTEEEAFNFFTRNFDPEPETAEIKTEPSSDDQPGPSTSKGVSKKPRGEVIEEEGEGEGKESTPLLSEVFVDGDMWKLQPTQLVPAEYVPLGVREKKEEGYFFVPSIKTVPSDQKVPENTQPRYLEDEGFYVGVRPDVSQRNQNIMEHRLLQRSDKGKGWFGEDGRIVALPDPVKDTPTRPRVIPNEERDAELQTVFRKAMISDITSQGLDFHSGVSDGQYQIDIDINTLVFTHHPYFSKEHVLESKLRQQYDQYLRRKQKDMAQYLTDKVLWRSLQTRRLRDYELQHDRQLTKGMLKTWRDIKKLREKDNCINTAVKLSIRKEEANAHEDEAVWKREIEDEIEEMRQNHDDDYQMQMDRYRAALQEWKDGNKAKVCLRMWSLRIFNVQSSWLFETGVLSSNHLANVYLNAPSTQMTSDKVHVDQFEFSSDQKVEFDHSAVGSGITFSIGDEDGAQSLNLLTSGSLYASVAWGLADDGLPLIPPAIPSNTYALSSMKGVDALAAIGATGIIDDKKLAKWLMEARLDPNDPANSFLLQMIKVRRECGTFGTIETKDYFRLEQLQQEFDFVTDEELETNRRFKLLQLREKEVEEFRNYKMVPAIEKEIAETFFEEYEMKLKKEEDGLVDEDMDARRAQVAKFIAQIRKRVIQRYRAAQHRYTLQDIVNESLVPDVSLLGDTLAKLVEPRRPLKPQRKERKTVTAQNLTAQSVNLLINIERAFEIPTRKPDPKQSGQHAEVRPFVEVVFQQTTKQTCVAEGANPNWNEELALPFKAPNNDYSASNLQTVKDEIYMNLFDETVIDLLQDDRDRTTNIHQRLEKRWLGSLSIPFSTIYFQGKVAGAIRVEAPSSLLGYERTRESAGRGAANATYLSVFITVEPPLAPPELLKEKFETLEDDELLNQAELLQAHVSAKFPTRQITPTVIDMNGSSVFVTRYFRALAPPPVLIEGSDQTQICERIARFVSLIPSISDSVLFPGVCNIWSTCQQFMQMLQGDEEEHAVLLVNYFLHLNKRAWLILGRAIPEGPTAYALSEEGDGQYWIWNPSTGEHYKATDSFCPLKAVDCLINQDNIWANIQIQEETSRLNFDVGKSTAWKPLFTSSFPNPGLSSMQEETLRYEQTVLDDVVDLQNKIEKKLRNCIMDWRPRHITRWNRHVIHTFREILKKLEKSPDLLDNDNPTLKTILESYNLCGFPLHMSYTDVKTIVDKVQSTGVHKNESNNVEFALAVHIHPYPNHILSVWIYLASVTRRR